MRILTAVFNRVRVTNPRKAGGAHMMPEILPSSYDGMAMLPELMGMGI